jgi:hypothetical protein
MTVRGGRRVTPTPSPCFIELGRKGTLTHWCPSPTPSNPQKHPAHDGRDAAGDPVQRPLHSESGTDERREACMNKGIEAKAVTPPAPSRDHLSARTAPVARRLTPTLKPTPTERRLTS